jgi:hypothetical protein
MNDDELANLLGEAPASPDPAFRYDVFARVSAEARRRAAFERAIRIMAAFTALGLFFPLTRAAGVTLAQLQPLFYVAAVIPLAYLLAIAAIRGPSSVRSIRLRNPLRS